MTRRGLIVALVCVCSVAPPLDAGEKLGDFYGRPVSFVKVFGQRSRREAAAGAVTGNNVYHASGLAVDRSIDPNPIYVFDAGNNRVLGFRGIGSKTADRVFGQPDAASSAPNGDCNLGMFGILFVVDNTYEGHPNGRVLAFLADDLKGLTGMFPDLKAKRVYCVEWFDQSDHGRAHLPADHPFSPVSVAFSKNNEMVIGNDGYYRDPKLRPVRQLYLYRRPLEKTTPDAVIELPLGAAAEMQFDAADNLVVLDHTWNKVWVINYHRDPAWLRPLD